MHFFSGLYICMYSDYFFFWLRKQFSYQSDHRNPRLQSRRALIKQKETSRLSDCTAAWREGNLNLQPCLYFSDSLFCLKATTVLSTVLHLGGRQREQDRAAGERRRKRGRRGDVGEWRLWREKGGGYLDIHDWSEPLRSAWSTENPRCCSNKSCCVWGGANVFQPVRARIPLNAVQSIFPGPSSSSSRSRRISHICLGEILLECFERKSCECTGLPVWSVYDSHRLSDVWLDGHWAADSMSRFTFFFSPLKWHSSDP